MGILNEARRAAGQLWSGIMDVMTVPLMGDGGLLIDNTPSALRPLLHPTKDETARQQEVIAMRLFHEGRHAVKLTERLREFLGDEYSPMAVRLNFVQKINRAIATRLIIAGFDCGGDDKDIQIAFAASVWDKSRMKSKRSELFTQVVRDGEAFVLIDFDGDNKRARLTPHLRYVSERTQYENAAGDGSGMVMVYPDDDEDQPPLYAAKRWIERVPDERGAVSARPRINLYHPNRVEKYELKPTGWALFETQIWTREGAEDGEPLGVPVVHLKSPGLRPAAREGLPLQKALNKVFIDLLAASDLDAWRLLVAFGWQPKSAEIAPGSIIGTADRNASEASLQSVEVGDPSHQIAVIDRLVALMADVSDVPLTLIQRSGQRAAEGTLQEEKDGFIALVRDHADTVEIALSDAMKIARRLQNTFGEGDAKMPEEAEFSVRWGEFWTRTTDEKATEAAAKLASGYTKEEVQRTVWNEDEETIAAMQRARVGDGFSAFTASKSGKGGATVGQS